MPVQKYRTSKQKKNTRRSHHALSSPTGAICPNCGSIKHSHTVCDACGHYKGKQVMEPKAPQLGFDNTGFDTAESN